MMNDDKLLIERENDTRDLSSTRNFSQAETPSVKKELTPEEAKKEEEKKISTSRLFILFLILDILLGAFVIVEIILLFINVIKG